MFRTNREGLSHCGWMSGARRADLIKPCHERVVGYKLAPKPEVRCDRCGFMFPRTSTGTCKYMRGLITASCTCSEFSPRERSE